MPLSLAQIRYRKSEKGIATSRTYYLNNKDKKAKSQKRWARSLPHGSRCKYRYGPCRCDLCRKANTDYAREWNRKNRDSSRRTKYKVHLRSAYNISVAEYEKMSLSQMGLCAICDEPPGNMKPRLVVDHNHETGKVRGLLCGGCNILLGNAKDSIALLRRAIAYLMLTEIGKE